MKRTEPVKAGVTGEKGILRNSESSETLTRKSSGQAVSLFSKVAADDLPQPERSREIPPPMPIIPKRLLSEHQSLRVEDPATQAPQQIVIAPRKQSQIQLFDEYLQDLDQTKSQLESLQEASEAVRKASTAGVTLCQQQQNSNVVMAKSHAKNSSYDDLKRLLDAKDLFATSAVLVPERSTSSKCAVKSQSSADERRQSLERSINALHALAQSSEQNAEKCQREDPAQITRTENFPTKNVVAKEYVIEKSKASRESLPGSPKSFAYSDTASSHSFTSESTKSSHGANSDRDSDTEPLAAAMLRVALNSPQGPEMTRRPSTKAGGEGRAFYDKAEAEDNAPLSRSSSVASRKNSIPKSQSSRRSSKHRSAKVEVRTRASKHASTGERRSSRSAKESQSYVSSGDQGQRRHHDVKSRPSDKRSRDYKGSLDRIRIAETSSNLNSPYSALTSGIVGGSVADNAVLMELTKQQLIQQEIQIQLQKQQLADLQQQAALVATNAATGNSGFKQGTGFRYASPPVSLMANSVTPTLPGAGMASTTLGGPGLVNSTVFGGSSSLSRSKSTGTAAMLRAQRSAALKRKPQKAGALPSATLLSLEDVKNCNLCGCSEFRRPIGAKNPNVCTRCYHDHNSQDVFDPDEGTNIDYELLSMKPS